MTILTPQWQIPQQVVAFYTTIQGGVSKKGFSQANMALHVGDNAQDVAANRAMLPLSEHIMWLEQVHGINCIEASHNALGGKPPRADAALTREKRLVCAVMTADCLPILICHQSAEVVAAVHAGWRGLAQGVLQNTLQRMKVPYSQLRVWIGPHIRQAHFEVGEEVKQAFFDCPTAFRDSGNENKFLCDMALIVKALCSELGIQQVTDCGACTYAQSQQFFSHRRATHNDCLPTGRMVTGIYIK